MDEEKLPAEVCTRIVSYTRPQDLPSLSRTCKSFQCPAEAEMYSSLISLEPMMIYHMCMSVATTSRLGPYVHVLRFYIDNRRTNHRGPLPREFWQVLRAALFKMVNLQTLIVTDPSRTNTWVFDPSPSPFPFKLTDFRIKFYWDRAIGRFVESQDKIRYLQVLPPRDEEEDGESVVELRRGALPVVAVYEGPTIIAERLLDLSRPLTHIQLELDTSEKESPVPLIPRLGALRKSLCSLSILDIPRAAGSEVLRLVSAHCSQLRHLGVIPFPISQRLSFLTSLTTLHSLITIEIECSLWSPPPSTVASQRMLVTELWMYRPSLQTVTVWLQSTRYLWFLDEETEEWGVTFDTGTVPNIQSLWRMV